MQRRDVLKTVLAIGGLAAAERIAQAKLLTPVSFQPSAAQLAAAQAEGQLTLYSSTVLSAMQDTIRAFSQRFPGIRVDVVRLSGGQLTARVEAEAANGVLAADVIDHSDRTQAKRLEAVFQDYAPPNAKAYRPAALCSPKLWPTIAPGMCVAFNPELHKAAPRSWWDLCDPALSDGQIGEVTGISGGTTWTRILFERKVLGQDYWGKQSATKPRLFPSAAPLADALIRGEVTVGPIIYDAVMTNIRDGAPLQAVFAKEGVPLTPYASGIAKSAKHPQAARLFLDWLLSDEGQRFSVEQRGTFSMLKNPPAYPAGYRPGMAPLWIPDLAQSNALHGAWVREWNQIYGVRQ